MAQAAPSNRMGEGGICIVLAAGFSQVERDFDASHGQLAGLPKALLPVASKPMLDHWWEYISQNRSISELFIVSNALKYKHFERWATARGISISRVVNSGATSQSTSRGVLRDVELLCDGLNRSLATSMGEMCQSSQEILCFSRILTCIAS